MSLIIRAHLNYLRMAPRKTRLLGDTIRGLRVEEAEAQLMLSARRARVPLLKLLRSAVANASHNHKIDRKDLYVHEIQINQGPVSKRWMPRARGASSPITKKTSHVSIVLGVDKSERVGRYRMPEKQKKEKTKKDGEHKERSAHTAPKEGETRIVEKRSDAKTSFVRRIFRRKSV